MCGGTEEFLLDDTTAAGVCNYFLPFSAIGAASLLYRSYTNMDTACTMRASLAWATAVLLLQFYKSFLKLCLALSFFVHVGRATLLCAIGPVVVCCARNG